MNHASYRRGVGGFVVVGGLVVSQVSTITDKGGGGLKKKEKKWLS